MKNTYNWIKAKIKWIIFTVFGISVVLAAPAILPDSVPPEPLPVYQVVEWEKPITDKEWAEDVKKENFNVKHYYQLEEMEKSQTEKLPKVQKDLDKFNQCPECIKWELSEQLKEEFPKKNDLKKAVDEEFNSQLAYYKWKTDKISQSIERIKKEKKLRDDKKVDRTSEILGTTYYVDPSTASGVLTGTWTFTNASTTVSGSGGNAVAELAVGDYIKVSNGVVWYKVTVITNDNTLTIARTFLETTVTDGAGATKNRDVSVAVGTATSTSYVVLDQFTEVARSAGDKVIVRRGKTERIDDWSDLNFTSDGTIVNPIVIEADYANAWGDDVDLSGTATSTLTFGSKEVVFAADISGALATGDWIYASGDVAKDFAYEVESISTTTVAGDTANLYLPYKGDQAGAGKTMTNMGDAPIWNTTAGNYKIYLVDDNYWKIQGLSMKGTTIYGIVYVGSTGSLFKDCIFECADEYDDVFYITVDDEVIIHKCRTYNHRMAIRFTNRGYSYGKNNLFDGNNVPNSRAVAIIGEVFLEESESKNMVTSDIEILFSGLLYGRNLILSSTNKVLVNVFNSSIKVNIEDFGGVIGDNRSFSFLSNANQDTQILQSETTIVRSGGGNTSIKVMPSTKLSTNWEYSKVKMFEYPIYADTTSKTYTVYFKTNATSSWTADPTNSELWIEAEYWGHDTNNHRRIVKSTGVIDFNGSTAWQSITVTAQPSQTGILYLRGYYAKTKEAESNIFYVDVAPVIE